MNPTVTEPIVLDSIPLKIDTPSVLESFRIKEGSSHASLVQEIVQKALEIAKPKAIYKLSFVEAYTEKTVVVDGTTLTSRVLRVNLDQIHRVFPFIATCGNELDEWTQSFSDNLIRFWLEEIKEIALHSAVEALDAHIENLYQPGSLAFMNPGSLEDWPLAAQPALFNLLGKPEENIGVRLTDSLLMLPTKSVSGIYFPTEQSFSSCQLCPRGICPYRKAPYNDKLFETKYALDS
jgi:hypothetical protein